MNNKRGIIFTHIGGQNQRRDDTATEDTQDRAGEDTHREKAQGRWRKPYKQRREEVQKVSKKRKSERYLITKGEGRHRHRRRYPPNAPQAPNSHETESSGDLPASVNFA